MVLDFSASWCGPCRMMEPVLQGWARELGPKVVFIKCDAEAPGNRALAASSGIRRAHFHCASISSVLHWQHRRLCSWVPRCMPYCGTEEDREQSFSCREVHTTLCLVVLPRGTSVLVCTFVTCGSVDVSGCCQGQAPLLACGTEPAHSLRATWCRAFPTFHIYRGGRVVGQVQGADRGGLRALVDAEARLLAPLEGAPPAPRPLLVPLIVILEHRSQLVR